ncbi:MAG TPA: 50S ribosomal protein L15 [Phycisphaerales bacterium]|nr:50S ribosomal protein L15 [Phycisphaerales bacterium]
MMIHDITALAGAYKNRKRVGRGEGSGHGKQSGRGNKGAGSRSGNAAKKAFEGGQMPYFRRLPKFGFTNAPFKVKFWTVNIGDIVAHPSFAKGGTVNSESLIKAGLVRDESRDLKILGSLGKEKGLKAKLTVEANRVSASAKKMITDAGGSVKETGTRRDRTRGIDLTSEDRTPKNLTKKLKRGSGSKAKKAVAADEGEGEKKA